MMTYPAFEKDDYFKIDVECHLSGDIKKYIDYFPAYKQWWEGTSMTARAFGAVPKAHSSEAPKAKPAKPELPEDEQLLVYMDRYGVDMACVLPESMMDTTGYSTKWSTNGYLLAAVEKHPDRFILQANVGPFIQRGIKNALWELDYLVQEKGCKIVKFYPPEDTYINDERLWPFYKRCEELGVIVSIHTGFSWCPPGKSKYCVPILLEDVVNDFWDLKVIAFHAGWPYCHDLNMIALTHPNVYISLSLIMSWSQNAPRRLAEIIGEAIQFAGPERIIWGTDFYGAGGLIRLAVEGLRKFEMPEDLQKGYGYAPVTDEVKRMIFGGNLARLLNIDTSKRRVK
ncbi:MAG: amidohydrolase family protein [Dehalococcoidales bacterium]|nr:amidohydrolase family protein [Dehalococcoidales bacterium]